MYYWKCNFPITFQFHQGWEFIKKESEQESKHARVHAKKNSIKKTRTRTRKRPRKKELGQENKYAPVWPAILKS